MKGVKLGGVNPPREVRVAPVGNDDGLAGGVRRAEEVAAVLRQQFFCAQHKVFGVFADPRMVQADMIGHKIQHQPHALRGNALAKRRQPLAATDCLVYGVSADGIGRANDILWRHVGQHCAVFVDVVQGAGTAFFAAMPDAHQPHRVGVGLGQRVNFRLGDIGQGDALLVALRKCVQPYKGVDLVDNGVLGPGRGHKRSQNKALMLAIIQTAVW